MLQPSLQKNDRKAYTLIIIVSVVVFIAVSLLGRYNLADQKILPFDEHIFAAASAFINATVAVLLLGGLWAIKNKQFIVHRNVMLIAMGLSILFLVCYIGHHLFAGETSYGETDGVKGISEAEKDAAGSVRTIYLAILISHIPLAGLVLPFILLAAYRALTGDYQKHKKLVRFVWPVWFYVAVTGVIIYWMIQPYYI